MNGNATVIIILNVYYCDANSKSEINESKRSRDA